jgi:hypothetical protein
MTIPNNNPDATPVNYDDPSQDAQGAPQDATQAQPAQPTGMQPQASPAPAQGTVSKPPTPNQPAPPAKADHGDIYKTILGVFAGGARRPVYDSEGNPVTDPNTGQVKTQPMNVKQLGAGILAGALSSMMAGFQHLPERNGNGVMQTHQNEAAAAGAQAGAANTSQARVAQAQGMSDQQAARRYQTMKQNLDLHSLSMAVDRQDEDQKRSLVDHASPQLQAMELATLPDGSPLIAGKDESESELQKRIKESGGDVTRDSAIPTGVRPEIGPDGKPTGRQELLWTSFHNGGNIAITQELKDEFPEKLGNVALGTQVPASAMTQLFLNKGTNTVANGVIGGLVDKVNEFNSGKKDAKKVSLDWNQLKKENPSFGALQNKLMGLSGLDPDQFIAAARAIDPRLAAVLQQKLNIDPSEWTVKRDADKKAAELKEARESAAQALKDKSNTPEGQEQIAHVKLENDKLKKENAALDQKEEDQDLMAQQLTDPYNLTALKDFGGRGADKITLLAKATRYAKEHNIPFDAGVVNARVKFLGEYEDPKSRAALNRGALNNMLQHAADLADVNSENKRLGIKAFNTPINKIKDQFGDPAYKRYETTVGVLKDELQLYFAGGFAPSKEQAATWDRIQSGEATPDQTEEFAKEISKLALRRADTANEGFKTVMGYDDPNLITPAAKAAAEHLSPELAKSVEKYGSGGHIGQPSPGSKPQQLSNFQVNPVTKQQIGQDANGNWYDVKTGKPYAAK